MIKDSTVTKALIFSLVMNVAVLGIQVAGMKEVRDMRNRDTAYMVSIDKRLKLLEDTAKDLRTTSKRLSSSSAQ